MAYVITEQLLADYEVYLSIEEKSHATIAKYMGDVRKLESFMKQTGERVLTKGLLIRYKEYLCEETDYRTNSINSYLVALNCFFKYMGWHELYIKTIKVQKGVFVPREREMTQSEFKRLVKVARDAGKEKLVMVMQTICATGMRVSEVQYLTVEAVRKGVITIYNKGKERTILIPGKLQWKLQSYIKKNQIVSGKIFLTRNGKALDRSYIWREMKKLCELAGVEPGKVFPHNLRALFARTYYNLFKDIAKLADMLGHSSIETTRIYVKTSGSEHRRQLDEMRLLAGV